MTVRAYPHIQIMVRCPECGTIFDLMWVAANINYNQHGQVTHGWTRCEECPHEFEFDTQYKE